MGKSRSFFIEAQLLEKVLGQNHDAGAHEGEDVSMKGKMCPCRGRCAHEGEDVPM